MLKKTTKEKQSKKVSKKERERESGKQLKPNLESLLIQFWAEKKSMQKKLIE